MPVLKEARKTWVPLFKIAATSAADIYGDWRFYQSVSKLETDPDIADTYELPVLIFFVVACVMGGLTLFSVLCRGFYGGSSNNTGAPNKGRFVCVAAWVNKVLALEILLEDLPQIALSALVTIARGQMTTATLLNVTTSGYNAVFNLLDILNPDDDDDEERDDEGAAPLTPALTGVTPGAKEYDESEA